MNRLLNIGFIPVGHWTLQDNEINYNLTTNQTTKNVLYSFISNGEIKYIGKTTMKLSQRMYGYQNPNKTQTTNIRINKKIQRLLEKDQPIDILILADNGLLKYGAFKINLAAGLEDNLIYEINPKWNLSGRNMAADLEKEKTELSNLPKPNSEVIPILSTFEISLGQTYYNQGFFNVSRKYSESFNTDKSTIDILIGTNFEKTIQGYINRTANKNGTPRIMGGKELKNWIKRNYRLNDIMKIEIISPTAIRLKQKQTHNNGS